MSTLWSAYAPFTCRRYRRRATRDTTTSSRRSRLAFLATGRTPVGARTSTREIRPGVTCSRVDARDRAIRPARRDRRWSRRRLGAARSRTPRFSRLGRDVAARALDRGKPGRPVEDFRVARANRCPATFDSWTWQAAKVPGVTRVPRRDHRAFLPGDARGRCGTPRRTRCLSLAARERERGRRSRPVTRERERVVVSVVAARTLFSSGEIASRSTNERSSAIR